MSGILRLLKRVYGASVKRKAMRDADTSAGTAIDDALGRAAELVSGSSYLIAFTGAGVSAESGIPTFRGPGGIWGSYDESHLELGFFMREPEIAWKTIKQIFYSFTLSVEPNDAHRVLARWEAAGRLRLVVTQNIDGLHRRAGSRKVAEFHGSCDELVCMRCGGRVPATAELLEALPPRCECGGLLKPGFVFFGEGIPEDAYETAFSAAALADACLVIGSTGTVYPAASIPRAVKRAGGRVVEINPEPSEFTDGVSDVFIRLPAAEAMRRLEAAVVRL
ncbi:MAG TPA: NAD-dependent protein deacylase [Spirochaetales bacterium]|nr:NAD-dependent protein deacylase [Spirochaetales bacterium]HPM71542.1 NAD-dependent protein deacylase [Spirochaetales bacterium]HQO65136.1 NAD-dependent protein deacylase [Spirochaetales bacterium]